MGPNVSKSNTVLFRNKSQKTKFDEELHDKMTTTINDLSSSKLVFIHIDTNAFNFWRSTV